jgi:hypothetical protein
MPLRSRSGLMFNQMTPADVVAAIGQAARAAARDDGASSEFARGQLLSAYSTSRHLSVELASYEAELQSFASDVGRWARDFDEAGPIAALAAVVEDAPDAQALGDATCVLLERLRADGSEAANDLRARIHARLRRLADREVELLADVIEGPRTP